MRGQDEPLGIVFGIGGVASVQGQPECVIRGEGKSRIIGVSIFVLRDVPKVALLSASTQAFYDTLWLFYS